MRLLSSIHARDRARKTRGACFTNSNVSIYMFKLLQVCYKQNRYVCPKMKHGIFTVNDAMKGFHSLHTEEIGGVCAQARIFNKRNST